MTLLLAIFALLCAPFAVSVALMHWTFDAAERKAAPAFVRGCVVVLACAITTVWLAHVLLTAAALFLHPGG